jgi:hypothetical protein
MRLYEIFVRQFPAFLPEMARERVSHMAIYQYQYFVDRGDTEAAAANLALWKQFATKRQRLIRFLKSSIRSARKAKFIWGDSPKRKSIPAETESA